MEENSALAAVMARAKIELKSGHAGKAYDMLTQYKSEGWGDGAFLALLGIACCMVGRAAEGVAALERALDVAPCASAHFNLGRAYQMSGNLEGAKECYGHAVSLDPTYQQALRALAALRSDGVEQTAHPDTGVRTVEYAGDPDVDIHAHLLTAPPDA